MPKPGGEVTGESSSGEVSQGNLGDRGVSGTDEVVTRELGARVPIDVYIYLRAPRSKEALDCNSDVE